ncbi:tape measure domain-containing protein [Hansschlegelia beijingensis]|uniref:Tape measure domain-containing protein n=1 Tax=Hansschlegelia beijingensis TaxID=1133344 RepID=A0A7W6GGI2_9HYPH|nr:tape measure protein [Hansschlegelia beijingensis]MBB3972784.1 tape measure domain-containing protein [Hansschlegelia beijingensis]
MADDLERLVVQLEASLTKYEKELRRAGGVADSTAKRVEARFSQMNKRLDGLSAGLGRNLTASLGAIGSALAIKEVANYADAWTRAKNSLAVAGVTGAKQEQVLEALFASAQKNAAPIGALTSLYGAAAQAQKELGASSEQLITFTDGVAVALKVAGKSSTEARGALVQLSQLLGSSRVMAEEFNSVNEGARPILMAVAAGLDAAGGSVSKLKRLVTEGAVSNRQFFEAFLKGMPVIQAMAKNATQTLAQGYTKVENALTKYIGEQDQSLGATVVLSKALNALADNFDEVADATLKVAAIIAAALVGRSIGGMVASLGIAIPAVIRFVAALRSFATARVALTGLSAAAGPVGAVLGVAAAAGLYLYEQSQKAAEGALRASEAIAAMGDKAKGSAKDIRDLVDEMAALSRTKLTAEIKDTSNLIAQQADAVRAANPFAPIGGRVGRGRGQVAPSGADLEFNRATEKFLNGGSLADYQKALDDLAKRYPQQVQKLAEAQKAAELYTRAIQRRAMQDKALAQQESKDTYTGIKRVQGESSKGEQERAEKRGDETRDFFRERDVEQNKTDREKDIDKRVDEIVAAMEKAGKAIDKAAVRLRAETEIDKEFAQKQTAEFSGDAVKSYVDRVVKAESGGKANAKNPYSSATGVGQFIEETWLRLFRKYYPEQAGSMGRDAILAMRKNADVSRNMIEAYAKESAEALRNAGLAVTEANLHLAHFLGVGGGKKPGAIEALKADPNASASAVLGADVVSANKGVFKNDRVSDALDYADRRANATRYAAGDLTPQEKTDKEFADTLRDSDQRTAAINREAEAIGKLTYAREYAAEKARLLEEIEKDGAKATPEQIQSIEAKADAYAKAQTNVETLKTSYESLRDAESFFAEGVTSAFTDIITGASSAKDAIRKLASSFLESGLQALLMGKGPLAGLFGTASADGGTGGLFGALFGGLFAEGGVMTPSGPRKLSKFARGGKSQTAAIFGEAGPEAAVPLPDGRRIPVNLRVPNIGKPSGARRPPSSGSLTVKTSIDLTGANGDETIRRISKEAAEAGVAKGLTAYDRKFNNRIDYADKHER